LVVHGNTRQSKRNRIAHRVVGAALAALSLFPIVAGCATTGTAPVPDVVVKPWSGAGVEGRRLVTDHFEIFSTIRDAPFEAALPVFLEALYGRFQETWPTPDPADAPLRVCVFGTRADRARFLEHALAQEDAAQGMGDVVVIGPKGAAVCLYAGRSTTLAALAHDAWRQYVALRSGLHMPAWLAEGLACYHEAWTWAGPTPEFTPENNHARIRQLLELVRSGRLVSLSDIVAAASVPVARGAGYDEAQSYAAQAWALVMLVRHGPDRHLVAAFDSMLADLAEGTFGAKVSAARLTAPGGTDPGFGEASLRTYFGLSSADVADAYEAHVLRLVGY
jgi:hypothetical protein